MRTLAPLVAVCALRALPGFASPAPFRPLPTPRPASLVAAAGPAPRAQEPQLEPRPVRTVPPSTLPVPVSGGRESDLRIAHTPPSCLPADALPLVTASAAPEARFSRAYVLFRAADAHAPLSWVPMEGDARSLRAALPRPLAGTRAVAYAIEVVDRDG